MKEIKPLTSLRGLFALWVLVFHIRDQIPVPWTLSGRGYLGVDFFFLLSGFVLGGSYGNKFSADGLQKSRPAIANYLPFIVARFGRLFPLHLAVIAFMLALGPISGAGPPRPSVIAHELTLTQTWNVFAPAPRPINGIDWSISTEWAANLLFPLFVAMTLVGSRRRAFIAAGLSASALVYVASLHDWSVDIFGPSSGLRALLRCFGEFTLGLIIYRYRERYPVFQSDKMMLASFSLAAIAIVTRVNDLLIVAAMIPALLSAAENKYRGKKYLSVWPLHWIGKISYSVYLTQIPVISLVAAALSRVAGNTWTGPIFLIAVISASLTASSATYILIEVPARDFIKSLVRKNSLSDLKYLPDKT